MPGDVFSEVCRAGERVEVLRGSITAITWISLDWPRTMAEHRAMMPDERCSSGQYGALLWAAGATGPSGCAPRYDCDGISFAATAFAGWICACERPEVVAAPRVTL